MKDCYIDSKGYWCYYAGANRGKRVHRALMEQVLGRSLRRDEVIHHKDANKLNNDLSNLAILTEREHNAVSAKQRWFLSHKYKSEMNEVFDAVEPDKGDVSFETARM